MMGKRGFFVVSVRRSFLFLLMLRKDCIILLCAFHITIFFPVSDQIRIKFCLFDILLYVHGTQLRSRRDGHLSQPHCSWAN